MWVLRYFNQRVIYFYKPMQLLHCQDKVFYAYNLSYEVYSWHLYGYFGF
jgi:hypothetical protein